MTKLSEWGVTHKNARYEWLAQFMPCTEHGTDGLANYRTSALAHGWGGSFDRPHMAAYANVAESLVKECTPCRERTRNARIAYCYEIASRQIPVRVMQEPSKGLYKFGVGPYEHCEEPACKRWAVLPHFERESAVDGEITIRFAICATHLNERGSRLDSPWLRSFAQVAG